MSKKYTPETIELYLKHELQGQELQAFEEYMNSDADFKKEVETQQFLYRGANKVGEDEMRAKLKNIRKAVLDGTQEETDGKVVSISQKKKINPVFRWSIAAAIIIALGAAMFWLFPQSSTPQDLFASYYKPYSEEVSVRGVDNASLIGQASLWYQNGDYQKALNVFQKILRTEPENAEIQLVTGICQLELNMMADAIQIFRDVKNPLYQDQAQWYLAMAHLKQGDLGNAKLILQKIKEGDFNYSMAQEILGD